MPRHFLSWIEGEGDEGKQEYAAGLHKGVQKWEIWGSVGGPKGHRKQTQKEKGTICELSVDQE